MVNAARAEKGLLNDFAADEKETAAFDDALQKLANGGAAGVSTAFATADTVPDLEEKTVEAPFFPTEVPSQTTRGAINENATPVPKASTSSTTSSSTYKPRATKVVYIRDALIDKPDKSAAPSFEMSTAVNAPAVPRTKGVLIEDITDSAAGDQDCKE